jgi:hypothetical protein
VANKFVLLVEGKDDEHVLYQLRDYHGLPETFRVVDKKGIDNLLETLDVELLAGGLERLGIVVDADTRLQSRWEALRNILVQGGYTDFPLRPNEAGTIVEQKGKRIGVWIMPDNAAKGMLEDFVGLLVPPGDVLWAFAQTCVDEVIAKDCRFPLVHRSKALIHTWLAWQEKPGDPLGLSIRSSRLNPGAPIAEPLINWLRRLFD